MICKIKEKLKQWIFSDELRRLKSLETSYKKQVELYENREDDFYRIVSIAENKLNKAEQDYKECKEMIDKITEVSVDVGYKDYYHSLAVVCVAGKPEYVKFMPLTAKDTMELINFLKRFEYSNRIIDSSFAFRNMVDRYIL